LWGNPIGRLSGFNYRKVVRKLKKLGFIFHRHAAGSYEIWFNPRTRRFTTIPNHTGDLPEGTLHAILKTAGISPEEFLDA
jgi:predicted RNA binding protein YcfA (HicA-like mRNA interferase family)